MDIKENAKNPDVWLRGLFIIVFGVILYFVFGILFLLIVFQFITKVISGNLNTQLANFSSGLTLYIYQIINYMTFQSDTRPFPFSPWPTETQLPSPDKTSPEESK